MRVPLLGLWKGLAQSRAPHLASGGKVGVGCWRLASTSVGGLVGLAR